MAIQTIIITIEIMVNSNTINIFYNMVNIKRYIWKALNVDYVIGNLLNQWSGIKCFTLTVCKTLHYCNYTYL